MRRTLNERSFIVKLEGNATVEPAAFVCAELEACLRPVAGWKLPLSMRQESKRAVSLDAKALQSFSTDQRYLLGVSGGRDSVALLHHLVEHNYRRLIVCHLDHRLRGRSSDADAKFVGRLAEKFNYEFELGRTDVAALARKTKQSI